MCFPASVADERAQDVQFTDHTISVNLRDGRVITVPLVWYPQPRAALREAVASDVMARFARGCRALTTRPQPTFSRYHGHLVPS